MTPSLKKITAFTLAEVLITLAIIGVIAAITIPNLMAKYQEQETISKLKKFYSTMSNAIQMAINENGTIDTWDIKSSTDLITPIIKYLKVKKDCGITQNSGCIPNELYNLDGTFWANYDKNVGKSEYYKLSLEDGSILWGRWYYESPEPCNTSNTRCGQLWYDTNGLKKPNTLGKDVFSFHIYSNALTPDKGGKCQKNGDGWGCAKYILLNGNMDYLHK